MNRIASFIATLGPIGYSKWAPGSLASLAAVLFVPLLMKSNLYPFCLIAVLITGIWSSSLVAKVLGEHDPSFVVIDEVCGILMSFLFVPTGLLCLVTGFLLFRFFDIAKPMGVRYFERFRGGFGIVLDDVAAGIYTNLILQILFRYASL